MNGGTGAHEFQLLWVDWADYIVSFYEEAGYERLIFPSNEKKMEYA